ncbi:zinc finger protein 45-like [Solea senegalensis]|uniref:Zinc finger protein 45-like n=1 Tax=Solea senegalensis TaxID=28829 RepID=A0AAV6QQB8_SOLSE|nr:zinc finger protein 45-like [Solea senegalensis]
MSRLELLNVFVNDRLAAAGEEIVRAVKDALVEYQSEILRSKEENERLRRLLNVAVQRLLLQQTGEQQRTSEHQRTEPVPTVHPQDDGQPCEWRSSVELLPQRGRGAAEQRGLAKWSQQWVDRPSVHINACSDLGTAVGRTV